MPQDSYGQHSCQLGSCRPSRSLGAPAVRSQRERAEPRAGTAPEDVMQHGDTLVALLLAGGFQLTTLKRRCR